MKLRDLKRSASEEPKEVPVSRVRAKAHYPYGLRIILETNELRKLGRSAKDFKVGDIVSILSTATIIRVEQSENEERSQSSVTLELRKLGLGK